MIDTPPIVPGAAGAVPGIGTTASTEVGSGSRLPPGTQLQTTVVRLDNTGNPVVQLGGAEITLASKLPLAVGSVLTLKVLVNGQAPSASLSNASGSNATFQAQLVSVNGQGVAGQGGAAEVIRAISVAKTGSNTQAAATQQVGASIINLGQGAKVDAVAVSVSDNAPEFLNPPARPGAAASTLKASDAVTLQILGFTPAAKSDAPAQTAQALPLPTAGKVFDATVIGTEKSGEAVLKTPFGTLKLPSGIQLEQGGTLQAAVLGTRAQAPLNVTAELEQMHLTGGKATVFNELVSALHAIDPKGAQGMIDKLFAKPNSQLPAKLLWFISQSFSGDADSWLGTEIRTLLSANGKDDVVEMLNKEFANARQNLMAQDNSGWNALMVPVFDGKEVQQAHMFMRKHKQGGGKKGEGEDSRFVVELSLEELGAVQVDGFLKPMKEANASLDIFIRSHEPFPEAMQVELLQLFSDQLELSGLNGQLVFAVTDTFPVNPSEEIAAERSGSIVA